MKGHPVQWFAVGVMAFGLGVAGGRVFKTTHAEPVAELQGSRKPLGSALVLPVDGAAGVIEQPELAERIEFLEGLTQIGLDELPDLVRELVAELGRGDYNKLNAAIDRWVELDPEGGFAFFLAEFPDQKGRIYLSSHFARRWARADPDAALAACQKSAPGSIRSVVAALGTSRPADFFRLCLGFSNYTSYYLPGAAQNLANEDPQAMLAVLPQLDETTRNGVSADLAFKWASKDAKAAIAWVRGLEVNEEVRARTFRALAAGLIDQDPELATEIYLEGRLRDNEPAQEIAIVPSAYEGRTFGWMEIAKQYARTDPLAAFEWAQAFADGPPHSQVANCAPDSASETIDYFNNLPEEVFETETPILPSYGWRPADLAEGLERISELTNPHARETAYRWLLPGLAKTDPQAAITAATEQLQSASDRARVLESAVATWGGTDPEAASTWLAAQEPSSDRDAGIVGLIQASQFADPTAALEWSTHISDEVQRGNAMRNILRTQPRSWARAALGSLDLSEAEREQITEKAALKPSLFPE